jgi:hypothetical protein
MVRININAQSRQCMLVVLLGYMGLQPLRTAPGGSVRPHVCGATYFSINVWLGRSKLASKAAKRPEQCLTLRYR